MKLAEFKYIDTKGKDSTRKVLILSTPTNKFSGIDVSKENDETIAEFAVSYEKIHDKYLSELESLKKSMDLEFNFRQFLEQNISDLKTEII